MTAKRRARREEQDIGDWGRDTGQSVRMEKPATIALTLHSIGGMQIELS